MQHDQVVHRRSWHMQFKQLYQQVANENQELRTNNGALARGYDDTVEQLRKEASQLKVLADKHRQTIAEQQKYIDALRRGQDVPPLSADAPALDDKELEDVPKDCNLFEVKIDAAELDVVADVGTFFTLDFYDHPTQVRQAVTCPHTAL